MLLLFKIEIIFFIYKFEIQIHSLGMTNFDSSFEINFTCLRLIDILNETGTSDWQLSSMVCKVLMNYSENVKEDAVNYFEKEEIHLLRSILIQLSGKTFKFKFHIQFLNFNFKSR
jgi:hypothetical protein